MVKHKMALASDIKIGDLVKLIKSSNPYVPVGTILRIESLSSVIDRTGRCTVFNVIHKGQKYICHREVIEKYYFIFR